MKRKGDLIFWEISELTTTKAELEALGFADFIPRNDYKSAMIKALKEFTKGNDKLYRRHSESAYSVSFTVFIEHEEEGHLDLQREVVIKLDKRTGAAAIGSEDTDVCSRLVESYGRHKETIDSNQLRAMILKLVKRDCYGVPMRKGGGIYFIDAAFDDKRDRLTRLFETFSANAMLRSVPIYDDKSTVEAIEQVVSDNIFDEMDGLIADVNGRFKDGSITKRQLEGDKTRAETLLTKIKVHTENLHRKAGEVSERAFKLSTALELVFGRVEAGIVEPDDFMNALKGL